MSPELRLFVGDCTPNNAVLPNQRKAPGEDLTGGNWAGQKCRSVSDVSPGAQRVSFYGIYLLVFIVKTDEPSCYVGSVDGVQERDKTAERCQHRSVAQGSQRRSQRSESCLLGSTMKAAVGKKVCTLRRPRRT